MDIYQYINSKAIREHLRKIGYKFNSMEAIWLVYQNYDLIFDEKCKAWEDIMRNMEDMSFPEEKLAHGVKFKSTFSALRDYILYKKESIKLFKIDNEDYFYKFIYYCDKKYEDSYEVKTSFKKYQDVINYIIDNKKDLHFSESKYDGKLTWTTYPFDGINIVKMKYGDEDDVGILYLKQNLEVCDISMGDHLNNQNDDYIYNLLFQFFDSMWFKFPVPFKKGDILYNPRQKKISGCNTGPFVFQELCECGYDISDMTAYGYFLYEDGEIYWECMHLYMDLEYYEDKISGVFRTLLPISNYLKGELELDLCVKGYHHILMQEIVKKEKGNMYYTKEGLELMGVDDDEKTDNK